MTVTVHFGARSPRWDGVRAVADLGVAARVEVAVPGRAALFLLPGDRAARVVGDGSPAGERSAGEAMAVVGELVRARCPAVTEVVPIGAVRRAAGADTAYLPVTVDPDLVFSRDDTPGFTGAPHALLTRTPHALVAVDLHRRRPDDLTFLEREVKLDVDADPRPAARVLAFGDGVTVLAGAPTACLHFHRIHDVGPSGLVEMTSDPRGGPTLLKHKAELGDPSDAVYRRLETVEPGTRLREVMAALDPTADPARVPVTPYFRRDRVRTNVFVAASRAVHVVYADHSVFLEGDHAPFTQVEIEFAGTVGPADADATWGDRATPRLDAEFAAVEALVVAAYAAEGHVLTRSRRRKYDWAVAEVFTCPGRRAAPRSGTPPGP